MIIFPPDTSILSSLDIPAHMYHRFSTLVISDHRLLLGLSSGSFSLDLGSSLDHAMSRVTRAIFNGH